MTIGQARTAGEKKKAIALTDEWEEFYEKLGVTQVWNCGNLTELFREIHSRFQPSQLCPQLLQRMKSPDIALKARRNYFLSALSTYDKKTGAYQLREGSKFLIDETKKRVAQESAMQRAERIRIKNENIKKSGYGPQAPIAEEEKENFSNFMEEVERAIGG